ncbi:MAG: hydrogenase maturation protease [Candidatus Marinimicrobia bacterium]|nr:hydrogenase maturation protease [Candidatus Neomarinimicrobiota bacterium]
MIKPIIICFGNILYGDDGIGEIVLEKLRESEVIDNDDIIFAGNDGLLLLKVLEENRPVIIVDAVRAGSKPGTIHRFNLSKRSKLSLIENHFTTHSFGLSEIIELTNDFTDISEIIVLGIEPGDTTPGREMTDEVKNKLDELVKLVVKEYNIYEEENINY